MAGSSLSPVEAARVIGILEESLEKLSFLGAMTPAALSSSDKMAEMVGDEIARTISSQRALEARYEEFILARTAAKSAANKAKAAEMAAEVSSLAYELREGMKHLCRLLKDTPDANRDLAQIAEERTALQVLLDSTIAELREGHYRSLTAYVDAQVAERDRPRVVAAREEAVAKELEATAALLREEEAAHTATMTAKRAELNALKDKLRKLKSENTLTLRYARKEGAARAEAAGKDSRLTEGDLSSAVAALQHKLLVENTVFEQSAELLKKEQEGLAKQAEVWKARLAEDTAAKDAELKRLVELRDKQHAELVSYQQRYEKDLQEMVEKQAEAERLRQEKAAAAALQARKAEAATVVAGMLGGMWSKIKAQMDIAAEAKKAKAGKKK